MPPWPFPVMGAFIIYSIQRHSYYTFSWCRYLAVLEQGCLITHRIILILIQAHLLLVYKIVLIRCKRKTIERWEYKTTGPKLSTWNTERTGMNYPTRNEMFLDNKRNGTRIDHERSCFLSHSGITYRCRMKNISLSGTLVSALDFASAAMQVGDTCGLFLSAESTMCPIEYTSRVSRLDSSNIALQFIGMTF
jgi:hypothetical protein